MHLKKYILPLLLVLSVCLTAPAMGQSKSKKQLEKEKTQLENEIKRLNADLAKAKKNTKLNANQLASLNKKILERNKLIDNINGQLSLLDNQISQMSDSITHVQSRRKQLQISYAIAIRSLYREYRTIDKWVLLFDTPSYNKALLRTKYFKRYNELRLQQANAIRQCEKELQDANDELMRQRNAQNDLLSQETRQREQLAKEQRQKEASVKASKDNEKIISKQLSNKEAQKRKLQQQIQRLIDEEVRKANEQKKNASNKTTTNKGTSNKSTTSNKSNTPSSNTVTDKTTTAESALSNDFASNKGKLAWPVAYTSISRNYGIYTHESGGQNMNNGIDLVTVQGTNVYAVFKGTVSRTFTCPNGTLGVIIRHGDYMTVYCNLASVSVKNGQQVSTRAVIGTVASDGNGHGEFSFQLWKGRESQNPRSWLR